MVHCVTYSLPGKARLPGSRQVGTGGISQRAATTVAHYHWGLQRAGLLQQELDQKAHGALLGSHNLTGLCSLQLGEAVLRAIGNVVSTAPLAAWEVKQSSLCGCRAVISLISAVLMHY